MFKLFKNSVFLLILCATLAVSTASLAMKTITLGGEVAVLSASVAGNALANRKAIASAVMKAKAKARLRRYIAAIPVAGVAAVAAFETQDYLEWREEHPDGTKADYTCEMAESSAAVVDDVLQSLPERFRPSTETLESYLPSCE